jgi:integrase
LAVGVRTATWCVDYKPRGTREDGRRHSKVRMKLGDALIMSLPDARTAARAAKVAVAQGRNPHAETRARQADAIAERALAPLTLDEALDAYRKDMAQRRSPSESTRRQAVHYANKAVRLLAAGQLAAGDLNVGQVRKLVRTMQGSGSEIRHVYGALSRFAAWMTEEGLIALNPCDAVPRRQRPKPGKAREHVPSLDELRQVWDAVADEPAHVRDLIRFLLIVPLRRNEAAGLSWSEVDLKRGWITIKAARMKNGEAHELPLAAEALSILERRREASGGYAGGALAFGDRAGTAISWGWLMARIRNRIGQAGHGRERRFSPHDIRRSFVTHLAERFDENLLDLMIAHKPASRRGSGASYQKAKRLGERVAVMAAWARMLLDREEAPNVFPLTRKTGV